MRRLQLHRRSMSNQSRTETSVEPSLASGSMDSYVTNPSSTAATSDDAQKWKDLAGSAISSPSEIGSDGATERQDSDPFNKLKPKDNQTGTHGDDEVVMVDSPTSEEDVETL